MSRHSDKLIEHFCNPRNVGVLAHANAVGTVGYMSRGDALRLMLQIDPQTDVITQARFQAFGCSCAIASSSAITEMVTGKTAEEALRITAVDIAAFLGGLPPDKMYCPVMGCEALQVAIAKFRGAVTPGRVAAVPLCKCFGISERAIEDAIRAHRLTHPDEVTSFSKAGAGCVSCFKEIESVLARVNGEMASEGLIAAAQVYRVGSVDPRRFDVKPRGDGPVVPKAPAPTARAAHPLPRPASLRPVAATGGARRGAPEQIRLIESAIDDLRPHLQRDGGDCELVDIDGNDVFLKLSGTCVDCQLASVTLSGVQARLADKLGLPLRVVPVQ